MPAFKLHKVEKGPSTKVTTTADEMIDLYKMMQLIRRAEVACDQLYKQRLIRGFLHLYNGQEAVVVGMEAAVTREDHVITGYRDHGFLIARGSDIKSLFCELLGKEGGASGGKGGSMHMYNPANGFWGGNGIVGAQVPIGAGLALALQYQKKDNVSLSFYGDGAANQGQIFESYNMAKLWGLPSIFICENNHYGMGTAVSRAAASTKFYTRGDYVPGIWVDGMDVYASKAGFEWGKKFALENGPLVMEMETYRYVGHSMSDPGISYRTKDEVSRVRDSRDPIQKQKARLLEHSVATEAEITAIDKEIKNQIQEAVKYAIEAPWPKQEAMYHHIQVEPTETRGRVLSEVFVPEKKN